MLTVSSSWPLASLLCNAWIGPCKWVFLVLRRLVSLLVAEALSLDLPFPPVTVRPLGLPNVCFRMVAALMPHSQASSPTASLAWCSWAITPTETHAHTTCMDPMFCSTDVHSCDWWSPVQLQALRPPNTQTQRASCPGVRNGVEGKDKHPDQQSVQSDQPFFFPLCVYQWLFLLKPPWCLFSWHFVSPRHLIVSFEPSHIAFLNAGRSPMSL